mmetsp:Transcript_28214/g.43696  ORF Transcript_28214/g.43696 Transcript_28214/m.43696 type:complete len:86 (+) Transcript_28214:422-679(+)
MRARRMKFVLSLSHSTVLTSGEGSEFQIDPVLAEVEGIVKKKRRQKDESRWRGCRCCATFPEGKEGGKVGRGEKERNWLRGEKAI